MGSLCENHTHVKPMTSKEAMVDLMEAVDKVESRALSLPCDCGYQYLIHGGEPIRGGEPPERSWV